MSEPVEWLADGSPRSPRFDDIYRSRYGALDQARQVFLRGCGLPAAWAGQAQWRILETGFGLGLNFLAAWRAWKDDPQRPRLLHVASIEAWPVSAQDIQRSAAGFPELRELADALASQWWGLGPGFHRLVFEGGQVLLTLCVGDVQAVLRELDFSADSVFLDGFRPEANPQMWELRTLKGVARLCRRGAGMASWTSVGEVRRNLAQCGFAVHKIPGVPPKRHNTQGVFDPAWQPKGARPQARPPAGRCIVIGAGLAGAAVAASLARRGWRVQVLDAASQPASGASSLPAGLLAPQVSPDDNLLSRLTRAGIRLTLQQAHALLREGEDFRADGVLEAPRALWHDRAGWVKPGALVRAWLAQPGIAWRGDTCVARIDEAGDPLQGGRWRALDAAGAQVAAADLVVLAAAHATGVLLDATGVLLDASSALLDASSALQPTSGALPGSHGAPPQARLCLQPVRGQVSWAHQRGGEDLPAHPVHGNGHFLAGVPLDGQSAWLCGATFDRGETDLSPRPADQLANLARLRELLPAVAAQLAPLFAADEVRAWTGVRCASHDRRPLVGELRPGLWLSTAMGSRGLSFAVLCAELLAARLHDEPLPLPRKLAGALDVRRHLD